MKQFSTDVQVDDVSRSGGRERGRLHNDWFTCEFVIEPSESVRGYQRGFAWRADFKASDGQTRYFNGVEDTRRLAKQRMLDTVTKHVMSAVHERRALVRRQETAEKLSVDAGVPLAR